MIRITLIKPLPLTSFANVNVSWCIGGALMNNFAFQKEAGIQADVRQKSLLLPAFMHRLVVNRISKYDAIGHSGPRK